MTSISPQTIKAIPIPNLGDVISGRYELQTKIGQGGFGVVFNARDRRESRDIALKMLLPHALSIEGVPERFKREVHLASQLTHASSVSVHDHGLYQPAEGVAGLPYIVMELLQGMTLREHLERVGRMSIEDTIAMLIQTLGSLAEAHDRGIVHRDMKPDNIFLCDQYWENGKRVVKVLDFGIAKAVSGDWSEEASAKLTKTGAVAGTPDYMAPEQSMGSAEITPALDIYAVGCIAYEMLIGHVPYRGKTPVETAFKHLIEPIPELPPELADHFMGQVVVRAMSKEPSQRFLDASHMKQALKNGVLTQMHDMSELLEYQNTLEAMPTAQMPAGHGGGAQLEYQNTLEAMPAAYVSAGHEEATPPAVSEPHRATVEDDAVVAPAKVQGGTVQTWQLAVAVVMVVLVAVGLSIIALNQNRAEQGQPATHQPSTTHAAQSPPTEPKPSRSDGADEALTGRDNDTGDEGHTDGVANTQVPVGFDVVRIESVPEGAKVFSKAHPQDPIGTTPMDLARAQWGGKPVEISFEHNSFESEKTVVDWSDATVSVSLRAKPPTKAKPQTHTPHIGRATKTKEKSPVPKKPKQERPGILD
ncbi:MAG: serine/threonine-protein kinase [Myxococcota bacterium]